MLCATLRPFRGPVIAAAQTFVAALHDAYAFQHESQVAGSQDQREPGGSNGCIEVGVREWGGERGRANSRDEPGVVPAVLDRP